MVKRRRVEADFDGATAIEATMRSSYSTVFVDTDLDTHLALAVADSDTVSDLKKKIMFEHLKCFPEKSGLKIFSVKVQRKGHYYHLPDTLLVRSAFEGIKKGWFLHVEASSSQCKGNDRGLLCLTYPQTEADNLCPSDSLKAMAKQKVSNTSESYPAHGNLASSSIVKQKEVVKVIGETLQCGTTANKVKKLGSKESSRGSTEVNHGDVLTIAIPQDSTAHGPIKAAVEQTLEDKSVRTDTTSKKKKKKKGIDSFTCHNEVAAKGFEQIESLLTNADSTIHVTPSGMKEIYPVKDRAANKECLGPVSKDFDKMNLVGRPMHGSIISGAIEPKSDVANTTGEQEELTPNCDFEMLMNEKLCDASTKDPVPSFQLPDSQGAAENNFGRKKSKFKKSTHCHGLNMNNIVEASQNPCASGQDKVRRDGPSDATSKVASILPESDVDHINEIGKEGKLSVTRGAETSLNDKAIGAATEQILSAKKALDDKGNIEAGKSGRRRKKKSLKKSAEKIPDKLDGEDETRLKCLSLTAGIGPITDHVTDQSKEGEISLDTGTPQISLNTEVKESSHNKDLMQVISATCKSPVSSYIVESSPKEVEYVSTIPSDLKVAEGHGKSKKKKTKKEVAAHADDVSGAPSAMHNPPANHFIQEFNQDKTATCKSSEYAKEEMTTKKVEIVSTIPSDLKVAEGHGKSKKRRTKKDVAAHADDVSVAPSAMHNPPANHFIQECNQDKTATCKSSDHAKAEMTSKEVETVSMVPFDSKVAEGHGNSGQSTTKRTKKKVAAHTDDVSGAPSAMRTATHFVQESNQDINVSPTSERKVASEQESKSAYAAGSHQEIEKGASEEESKSASAAGSHQEVERATFVQAEIVPIEEKRNEVEPLQLNQTDKNQETVSLVKKELKKKTKKSQKTSKKSKSITDIQDQDVGLGELTASNDSLRDVSPLTKQMEIDVSAKLENPGIDSNSKSYGKDLRDSDAFRVPSDLLAKGTLEEMHEPEATTDKCRNLNFNIPGQQQGEHEPEINTDKSGSINFKQYFIPGQQQGEVAAKKGKKSNKATKAGGKSKKDGVTSMGASEDISTLRTEVTVPSPSSAKRHKTFEEAGKLATLDSPAFKKENKEVMDESMSSSSSKGSDRFPEDRKQQAGSEIQSLGTRNAKRRAGDLEDCTKPEKGYLPTSGPKFGDCRSRSSDRKGGYSDCSTETPSDYSSSSGYSGEGSEISQASTPNGANGAKNTDAGAKHKVKSNILSPNVTIDMILRSSSRFKKAKVTAAQCQDEEILPVDVVPDSLPNP